MKTLEEILAPLEELRGKSTAGPWERDADYIFGQVSGGRPGGEVIICAHPVIHKLLNYSERRDNASFIVALERSLPDLIAVKDGLRKVQEDWIKNGNISDFFCSVNALVGWRPANPKPAAEEPRT